MWASQLVVARWCAPRLARAAFSTSGGSGAVARAPKLVDVLPSGGSSSAAAGSLLPSKKRGAGATAGVPGSESVGGEVKYRGVTQDKKAGGWRASITVNGKRIDLGLFDDAKNASDAYFAAKSVYADQQYSGRRKAAPRAEAEADAASEAATSAATPTGAKKRTPKAMQAGARTAKGASASSQAAAAAATARAATDADSGSGSDEERDAGSVDAEREFEVATELPVDAPNPVVRSSRFRGVMREGYGATMWEAVIDVNGREISGGEYEDEEEAARAYDALARMYLGPDTPTNFALDSHTSWVPPEAVAATGQIETKVGVPLSVEEVVAALKQERGVDVVALNVKGKTVLTDHMVFVTGQSVPHMRKMADMLARAIRKRRIRGANSQVEARDMDDWMVVDAGNLIVNIMTPVAREAFALEEMYENMKEGEDQDAGLTYDEWLEKNPIPEVWLKRLEEDEEEIEAAQRVPDAPSAGTRDTGAERASRRGPA